MSVTCCSLQTAFYVLTLIIGAISVYHFARQVRDPKLSIQNGRVLITGGSKGIGIEVAKECIRKGASVAILARNARVLQSAQKELKALRSDRNDNIEVITISADVSDFEAMQRTIKDTFKQNQWDSLDAIVCNAGVECVGSFESLDVSKITPYNGY